MRVFEFVDAVTGEALSDAEAERWCRGPSWGTAPWSRRPSRALRRRSIAIPSEGEYTLRVDGDRSQRWFGCEASLPAAGARHRRVRVALVPRTRDVEVQARFTRDGDERAMPRRRRWTERRGAR
ncbi:MAG: hypothetical protein R3A52_11700 [Polyangiales bacterium]